MNATRPTLGGAERAIRLAKLVLADLEGTGEGHCARVNYLDREEATALAAAAGEVVQARGVAGLAVRVLAVHAAADDSLNITADRAIELRNRKRGRVCLLVPADVVDATASSLGNSFAEIDGRQLLRRAYDELLREVPGPLMRMLRDLRAALRRRPTPSDGQWLDFALSVAAAADKGQLDQAGLELWRLGLIADARPGFLDSIGANRSKVNLLSRPRRLAASPRERIAALDVDAETARNLERFFASRPMHDVVAWSRAIAEEPGLRLTFDQWVFPEQQVSDLEAVIALPFTDRADGVLKASSTLR